MDTEAGGSGDRTSVLGEISSQPCVEDTERYGVECTEAGEVSSREERGSYSSVARRDLARG